MIPLFWVSKLGWIPFCKLSHLYDPQIHLLRNTCWLYSGQHGGRAFSIDVFADVSTSIGGGSGLETTTVCAARIVNTFCWMWTFLEFEVVIDTVMIGTIVWEHRPGYWSQRISPRIPPPAPIGEQHGNLQARISVLQKLPKEVEPILPAEECYTFLVINRIKRFNTNWNFIMFNCAHVWISQIVGPIWRIIK